jgi:hypothetical protein
MLLTDNVVAVFRFYHSSPSRVGDVEVKAVFVE